MAFREELGAQLRALATVAGRLARRAEPALAAGLRESRRRLGHAVALARAGALYAAAEMRYRARVGLFLAREARARLEHRLACRRAGRRLAAAEREATRRVSAADARFRSLARPAELAAFGPYSLRDESLRTPEWEVSLQSVRAVLVPREAAVIKEPRAMKTLVPVPEHPPRGSDVLLLRSRSGISAHGCSSPEEAREFARLVNVSALNSSRLSEARRDELDRAAGALEAVRAEAVRMMADARREAEAIAADTARVRAARERVEAARRETAERDRRRAALAHAAAQRPA